MHPGFSLSIIIDSRVKIIGNERPGASPCDPRGRLHANNTKSIVLYSIRLHIRCSYFTFSLGFFSFFISCGGSKYKTNSKYRHPRYYGYTYVIGLHKSTDVLFHKMLSSSNQCNQSIIVVFNSLLIVLPEKAP